MGSGKHCEIERKYLIRYPDTDHLAAQPGCEVWEITQIYLEDGEDGLTRRVRNVLVGGEPLDPEKTYTLTCVDYQLLNHGDGYTMYDGCKVLQESVKLDNQVLIDYITESLNGVVGEGYENPYGEGRIVSVNAE